MGILEYFDQSFEGLESERGSNGCLERVPESCCRGDEGRLHAFCMKKWN